MAKQIDANQTRQDLRHMFDLWGIEQFSIMREQEEYVSGGMKRGNGVTITYLRKGAWQTVYCNHFDYPRNMRAVFLFLDRVRIAEKTGIAYQGLSSTKDLARSESTPTKNEAQESLEDAYDVLGASPQDPVELIKKVYSQKAQFYHPDKSGGDAGKFKRLTAAYELILKARGGKE